jgi:hypothetical protein
MKREWCERVSEVRYYVMMVWYGTVWYGTVRYGVVWCGVVRYGVVWCGVVRYGVVWCGVVWCGGREQKKEKIWITRTPVSSRYYRLLSYLSNSSKKKYTFPPFTRLN